MSRVSPKLHAALQQQLREMYAFAQHDYASFENEARLILDASETDYWANYAIRCWWLDNVDEQGGLRSGWQTDLVSCCRRTMEHMRTQVAELATERPAWVSEDLLTQTACVLQRRRFAPVSLSAAVSALQSIGRLAGWRVA